MYNTSKYYSYIFYADRNVRPWMILGYTTFPKVAQYIYLCTTQEEIRTLAQLQEKGPCTDLKMKRSKCNFFKKHIHYLGHLISANGIRPLKDKLDTICDMPAPHNSKEVKQFLSLVSYYRKFVP